MRSFLSILTILFLFGCNNQNTDVQLKLITATTASEEARALFYQALEEDEQNGQNVDGLLKSALDKDPDFILAKALLNSPFARETANNIEVVSEIVNNSLDKVSEMEALFIKAYYYIMTSEFELSAQEFNKLKELYPDYHHVWLYSGVTQSYIGDVKVAITDLERAVEIDKNNFLAYAFLMAKHIVVGTIGNMLPTEEIDILKGKEYIDKMILINPNNSFAVTMAGNYERSISNFEKAIEYYTQVGQIPSEDNYTVYASNHYLALTNTFLNNYSTAEDFFRKNIDEGLGSFQRQALWFMGNLHIYNGDFDRSIDALDEYIEKMPGLDLPTNVQNNQLASIHFAKFLCYSHNQLENESKEEIATHLSFQNKNLEFIKASLSEDQYLSRKKFINNFSSLLYAWHDVLFGRYDDARSKLKVVKEYGDSEIKNTPWALYDYNGLNGIISLNEGDFEKAKVEFEKNIGQTVGYLELDVEYYDYFYALSLKGTGNNEEASKILDRIANANFYGYTRALVRELALSQI